MKKLRQAGKAAKEATVYELREDSTDRSQRKGDLVCDDLLPSGKSTILDVGITYPLIDTNVNNKSTEERGYAANKYGDKKNKDYNEIIALANDVERKQAFMQHYGKLCSSAAASFDEHGHNDEASYYLSNDPVLLAAYDHFKNTLEAAWSSTTVDAEFTSCSR